jgi:hypothetical protein
LVACFGKFMKETILREEKKSEELGKTDGLNKFDKIYLAVEAFKSKQTLLGELLSFSINWIILLYGLALPCLIYVAITSAEGSPLFNPAVALNFKVFAQTSLKLALPVLGLLVTVLILANLPKIQSFKKKHYSRYLKLIYALQAVLLVACVPSFSEIILNLARVVDMSASQLNR